MQHQHTGERADQTDDRRGEPGRTRVTDGSGGTERSGAGEAAGGEAGATPSEVPQRCAQQDRHEQDPRDQHGLVSGSEHGDGGALDGPGNAVDDRVADGDEQRRRGLAEARRELRGAERGSGGDGPGQQGTAGWGLAAPLAGRRLRPTSVQRMSWST